jgi:hypothetical protein
MKSRTPSLGSVEYFDPSTDVLFGHTIRRKRLSIFDSVEAEVSLRPPLSSGWCNLYSARAVNDL